MEFTAVNLCLLSNLPGGILYYSTFFALFQLNHLIIFVFRRLNGNNHHDTCSLAAKKFIVFCLCPPSVQQALYCLSEGLMIYTSTCIWS